MAVLSLTEKLDQLGTRYDELTQQLSTAEVASDSARYQKVAKQHAELEEITETSASPERSPRRKERHRRDSRRHRGR